MDGSVSKLARSSPLPSRPQSSHAAFVVGLVASLGVGISMGFAEALSDDGSLTGRWKPLLCGIVCGFMTTTSGIGYSLPFLIPNFRTATVLAVLVVAIDSWSLVGFESATWIRHFFDQCFKSLLVDFA